MDLLDRDPAKRPTPDEILDRLGITDPQRAVGTSAVVGTPDSVFVGRREQLAQLEEARKCLLNNESLILFVRGNSGFGKSSLVKHFLNLISQREDGVILSGRCYERESVPYKAWDSLMDSLAEFVKTQGRTRRKELTVPNIAALINVFPAFGAIKQFAKAAGLELIPTDQQELRRQAFEALRELLSRLAQSHSLVLYIDDLQWGDEDSAALMLELLKPPNPPQLLLLATYREEDVGSSQFLDAFEEACNQVATPPNRQEISVGPLTDSESVELVLSILDRSDEVSRSIATRIASESGGNPLFIRELTRMDNIALAASTNEPLKLDEVLWRRISKTPEATQQLLQLVAVCGTPIEQRHAFFAAQVADDGPAIEAVLRAESLIRTIDVGDGTTQIACYHDRIRETILDRISDQQRRTLHLRIAEQAESLNEVDRDFYVQLMQSVNPTSGILGHTFEDNDKQGVAFDDVIFDLSFHYDAAGRPDLGLPYALAAAGQAHRQYSFGVAAE